MQYRSYNKETEDLNPKRRFAYMNDDGTIRDFNGMDPNRLKKASENYVVVQPQDPDDTHSRCFDQTHFDNYMHDYDNGDEVSEEISNWANLCAEIVWVRWDSKIHHLETWCSYMIKAAKCKWGEVCSKLFFLRKSLTVDTIDPRSFIRCGWSAKCLK